METTKYSIHRCLSELKTLDARINKAIMMAMLIEKKKVSSNKIPSSLTTIEDFKTEAMASHDSIMAMISRRARIKNAIVISNATTFVTIAGTKMTVAEAIERKESIDYEKSLLNTMARQYNNVITSVTNQNNKVELQLDAHISTVLGNDKTKIDGNLIETITKSYKEQNMWEMVDPLELKSRIDKLDKHITDFTSEVDYKLSTSNSITEVDIAN